MNWQVVKILPDKVLPDTFKKRSHSLSSKLNEEEMLSELNVRTFDRQIERKKVQMKTLKKKMRKINPACPTDGKWERAWKDIKWMFQEK